FGCRFPGADDPDAFWRMLREGRDLVGEVPGSRRQAGTYRALHGQAGPYRGGFLTEVDRFDAEFFKLAAREAVSMDPQQRLLLEVAWEALEDAGIVPATLAGSATGVFVGISTDDYAQLMATAPGDEHDAFFSTGNAASIAANRLSYFLDLQGPSLAVDTACSSSLVATHLACQCLLTGESDLALAGGVNLILSSELADKFRQAGVMSSKGCCMTFDAAADGYVRGEGCGVVVMKRLADARRDGDPIRGVIRGTAVNHDGRSNGLMAPNGLSQQAVIRQALANAGCRASQIGYVEAHGTGTALGDAIEVHALKAVLLEDRGPDQACLIGSVKTNIGHTEAAAGIAGLLKVVLGLQHEAIPPTLHLHSVNPQFAVEGTPLSFPLSLTPWSGSARVAGISSFSFGGTNAHLIVEQAPPLEERVDQVERPRHLLTLSAQTEEALLAMARRYAGFLATAAEEDLADICYTANTGRTGFAHRLGLVAGSVAGFRQQLERLIEGGSPGGVRRGHERDPAPPAVAFLFTGQGAQYVGMGAELYRTAPVFRETLDRCDAILQPLLGQSVLTVLYPETGDAAAAQGQNLLDQTRFTQTALFTIEYALAALWASWGISPQVVMGHSLGEYVAACVAGVFTLEDGLRLVAERGRLMQSLPKQGRMATVFAGEGEIAELIRELGVAVAIAAVNGPEVVVVSGAGDEMETMQRFLQARGVRFIPLKISQGFHSPQTEAVMDEFRQLLSQVRLHPPRLPVISNLSGKPATAEMGTPEYWCRHLRQPVRFADGMQTLHAEGYELLLEIGPEPELLGLDQCLPEGIGADLGSAVQWLPSLRSGVTDWQQMLESLAALQLAGVALDWAGFEAPYQRRRLSLPTYPFQRRHYWAPASSEQAGAVPTVRENQASTSLLDLLARGESRELEDLMAAEGALSPAVAEALPQIVRVLSRRHRQETTAAAIEDWLYRPEWQPRQRRLQDETPSPVPGGWLILADQGGLGASLAQVLAEPCCFAYAGGQYLRAGDHTWYVDPAKAEDFEQLLAEVSTAMSSPLKGIIHLWSLEVPASEWLVTAMLPLVEAKVCDSTLYLVQALAKGFPGAAPRVWLLTRGAVQVEPFPVSVTVGAALLWGFGKTLALEYPQFWGGLIDLAPDISPGDAADLVREIRDGQGEDQVVFRQGQRFVPRLVRTPRLRQLAGRGACLVRSEASYLITGGGGALGLALADWLVRQGAGHLLLCGRRGAAAPEAKAAIDRLRAAGVQVVIMQADVSDEAAMTRIFTEVLPQHPPLAGVIHAAGVPGYEPISEMTHEGFTAVLRPKVAGSWLLHQLTRQLQLDFFVCFSSMASVLGAKGEAHYVAANQFMDALCHFRRQAGLPALSLNLGPVWGGGMSPRDYLADVSRMGVGTIELDQIPDIFAYLLGVGNTQVMLANLDWHIFKPLYELRGPRPLVEQIESSEAVDAAGSGVGGMADPTAGDTDAQPPGDRLQQLRDVPFKEQRRRLLQYIQEAVTGILGYDADHQPNIQQGFFDMGMNSLMAIELRKRLEIEMGMALPVTVAFDHGNIGALAQYIGQHVLGWQSNLQAATPQARLDLEGIAQVKGLSGAEVQSSLDSELEQLEALLTRD
ncbi:MAG: SDR family NAD(P)-dependent oxidoreductase, partial [Chromatiales bacterium]